VRVLTRRGRIAFLGEGAARRRPRLALLLSCVVLVVAFGPATTARGGRGAYASGCPGAQTSAAHGRRFLRALLCLHDAERRSRGLHSLRAQGALRRAAKRHARDMVRHRYFGHFSPAGSGPVGRALSTGYRARRKIEVHENILTWSTSLTPAELMQKWMASPPHRADILCPRWHDIGIGVVRASTSGSRGITVAVEFGRRYR
jgi:uncharacterized protein YkwD